MEGLEKRRAPEDALELRRRRMELAKQLYGRLRLRKDGITLNDVLEDLVEAERVLSGK